MRQLIHRVSFEMVVNFDKYVLSGLVKRNTKFCILCKAQCLFCSLKYQKLLINSTQGDRNFITKYLINIRDYWKRVIWCKLRSTLNNWLRKNLQFFSKRNGENINLC
jgi:hypothetical protein